MIVRWGRQRWPDLAGCAQIHDHGSRRSRSPRARCAYHNLNLDPDREAAYEESDRFLGEYYGPVLSREATRHWTATGTPEQVVADIEQLYADGATEVTLRITSWDWRRQLDLLVKEVIRRLESYPLTTSGASVRPRRRRRSS